MSEDTSQASLEAPADSPSPPKPNPLREIVQPFIDLVRAPRALWGINVSYFLEGLCYFGMLQYLAMHFTGLVFQGVEQPDVYSHHMVMVLTAGITITMFFMGWVADRRGVRFALLASLALLLAGRFVVTAAPTLFGLKPQGLWSPLHLVTMGGILLVVVGYGMYQPAAYAGVRKFTTAKTSAMAYAMLYALMNLGGFLPTFGFLLRDKEYLDLGITGVFGVYTALTAVGLVLTAVILTRKTEQQASADAEREKAPKAEPAAGAETKAEVVLDPSRSVPLHLWGLLVAAVAMVGYLLPEVPRYWFLGATALAAALLLFALPKSWRESARVWLANHPLADGKFFFFIFALIPVQTLFTYNWLIIPQYVERAYTGWISQKFEVASNFNPLLIFILVPVVAALTQRRKVYNMMIVGTFVMAAPAFFLALGTNVYTLFAYLVFMTIGEAMWQPRFLQYAAEIAPEGRTGEYMGVAQFPWFLTKMLVPLYSGLFLTRYCADKDTIAKGIGAMEPERMWLYFGIIAMGSTVMLIAARRWVGKDFRTKAEG
ncbi:MAG TPA: hypothetical protein DFS52_20400 [Myxococcales bacterium]|jgi:MFS family permease|nr:hypothetical protein [Myxococcales bacterium]